jgi:serine/threonine-protein kinase
MFVMPDVRGMYWVDAEPMMRSLGWNGSLAKLPNAVDSGLPSNAIVDQVPPPGQKIPTDVVIQLQFAG